ncbi:transposase [Pseudoclavibacter helvolus]|uniref:transposase n=1 Tax=Pseudoclavibacter helvolus TaxID=255205 RepID=UPI0009EC9CDB|nr:transposase [Pseudoclavibacter helvolus]
MVDLGRLDDRSRAPARNERHPSHRGLHRITRIRSSSRLITRSAAPEAGDSPMFLPLLEQLRVARPLGRPRTRPDAVRGDKAYSSRAIRAHLRERGIRSVIPEPADQQGNRKRRGSRGGRPVGYDRDDYRGRNVIERRFCHLKQWRGLATRYDKLALVYRAAAVLNAVIAWTKALSDMP